MQKELNINQTQKNEKNKYQRYKKTSPQQIILSVLENEDITKVTSHFQKQVTVTTKRSHMLKQTWIFELQFV